jgi:hypothetical protein
MICLQAGYLCYDVNKGRKQILVGATTICCPIWKNQNDTIFYKSPLKAYMQLLFSATHWCRHWTLIQPCENTNQMKDAC